MGDNKLFVAAIDFGTTFSGYAFGVRKYLIDDPKRVTCIQWYGNGGAVSHKVPTTVLLDERKNFVDFGYKAEEKYAEFAEDNTHAEYYYFRRFKMMLYDQIRKEVNFNNASFKVF